MGLVDTFYNLVTDFYEWGWGESFHFSTPLPGQTEKTSEVAHEVRIATLCNLRPGMKSSLFQICHFDFSSDALTADAASVAPCVSSPVTAAPKLPA